MLLGHGRRGAFRSKRRPLRSSNGPHPLTRLRFSHLQQALSVPRALRLVTPKLRRRLKEVRRALLLELREQFGPRQFRLLDTSRQLGYAVVDADGTLWDGDLGHFFYWLRERDAGYRARTDRKFRKWRGGRGRRGLKQRLQDSDPLSQWQAADSDGFYREMTRALHGRTERWLMQQATEYFTAHHHDGIFPETAQLLRALESSGLTPWIVSGSPYWLVKAGARAMGLPGLEDRVIGLRLKTKEVDGERVLLDEFDGPVPWGEGKVAAIKHWIVSSKPPAVAIGNDFVRKRGAKGGGDAAMLEYASHLAIGINGDARFAERNDYAHLVLRNTGRWPRFKHGFKRQLEWAEPVYRLKPRLLGRASQPDPWDLWLPSRRP